MNLLVAELVMSYRKASRAAFAPIDDLLKKMHYQAYYEVANCYKSDYLDAQGVKYCVGEIGQVVEDVRKTMSEGEKKLVKCLRKCERREEPGDFCDELKACSNNCGYQETTDLKWRQEKVADTAKTFLRI